MFLDYEGKMKNPEETYTHGESKQTEVEGVSAEHSSMLIKMQIKIFFLNWNLKLCLGALSLEQEHKYQGGRMQSRPFHLLHGGCAGDGVAMETDEFCSQGDCIQELFPVFERENLNW